MSPKKLFKLIKILKNTSVSASKLLITLTTMKFTVFVIFAILVENSVSIPLLKRSQRSPQFVQNYAPGSQSQNFNCQYGGCGNIGGMQQIHGSHVSNHGSQFRYVYLLRRGDLGLVSLATCPDSFSYKITSFLYLIILIHFNFLPNVFLHIFSH